MPPLFSEGRFKHFFELLSRFLLLSRNAVSSTTTAFYIAPNLARSAQKKRRFLYAHIESRTQLRSFSSIDNCRSRKINIGLGCGAGSAAMSTSSCAPSSAGSCALRLARCRHRPGCGAGCISPAESFSPGRSTDRCAAIAAQHSAAHLLTSHVSVRRGADAAQRELPKARRAAQPARRSWLSRRG